MSIRLVTTGVDSEEGVMLRSDFNHYADTLDCLVFLFLLAPTPKPMYNTILQCSSVRYNLAGCLERYDLTCQGLAGPWYAQRERGAVKARIQWFNGSKV